MEESTTKVNTANGRGKSGKRSRAEAASDWAEKNKASFALGRVISAEPEG